jgi:competence protein ComEC
VSLVVASAVAGFATAPVAAAHFNRIADYGLLANLLAMPVMGTLVMPSAVLAGVLAPFGLSGLGLALMEQGTRWILWVAHWVSGMDGAVRGVVQPRPWALPALALGALWLMLWPGRARIAGLVPMAVALAFWSAPRPPVLVAPAGALVGVLENGARTLSKPRGAGFAARLWLEQDGTALTQLEANALGGWTSQGTAHLRDGAPWPVAHLAGRNARDLLADHCRTGVLVVMESTEARPSGAARAMDGPVPRGAGGCWLVDGATLRGRGAAIWPVDGQPMLHLAGGTPGARPWLGRAPRTD